MMANFITNILEGFRMPKFKKQVEQTVETVIPELSPPPKLL